jgi:hypothetical protein
VHLLADLITVIKEAAREWKRRRRLRLRRASIQTPFD